MTGSGWRTIRLGAVAELAGEIGSYIHPGPNISSLGRVRHQRIEPGNNLLVAPAENDVFAGRANLQFLYPGLGGLQVSNDLKPFEIHGVCLLQNIE